MVINRKIILILSIGLIILNSLPLISCQSTTTMENKFDWSATLSAPQEYPIQVYSGKLIAKDYQQSLEGFGTIDFGWGVAGGSVVMGPDLKNIPHSIEIGWHSFVDQKNFEGKWPLPIDEISKLVEKGISDPKTNKKTIYNEFIIGLAPNGLVVLWLSGAGSQIEIAHFKANQVEIDPTTVSDPNKSIFSEKYNTIVLSQLNEKFGTIEKIKQKQYPDTNLYEKYRVTYFWKPIFELSENFTISNYTIQTYNGELEAENFKKDQTYTVDLKQRGVLYKIAFSWFNLNSETKSTCWLEAFDENELFDAYKKFNSIEEIKLIVKVETDSSVTISLKSVSQEVKIKKFKSTIE
jgi:Protein of unknown function (DUF2931)